MSPHSAPWHRSTRYRSLQSGSGSAFCGQSWLFRLGGNSDASPPEDSSEIDSREPIEHSLARSRIEALLLIAKSPLNYRRLAALAELEDATQARTLVTELNELYDANGRGIRIEQIAGGCRLMTRAVVSPWLRRLGVLPPAVRLSWPMMETLAIVAYRQDVTRADVEAVRGVACGEILRQLMSLDLVRISGRSDDLGRPYLYGTTKRFLKICGLASINALPAIDSQGFCDDVSDSANATPSSPNPESDESSDSPVPKESDVSLVMTEALATDSVLSTIAHAGEAFATGVASPIDPNAAVIPTAVIEDEEDDLYEKGLDVDDDEDFVDDDEDDDWDDDDDEEDDDDDEVDDVEDDDDADDSWEEVDDDEADEEWEDDDDEEDDDWDEDDDDDDDEEEEEV